MRFGAIAPACRTTSLCGAGRAAENVPEVRFHHDARDVVLGETAQFPGKPLAGADDGGDEILESLSLHRNGILMTLDGVIPGGEGAALWVLSLETGVCRMPIKVT